MTDKEGKADAQPFHLVLLATDATGYRNLCRLVTDAHIDGYYYKPRIDREQWHEQEVSTKSTETPGGKVQANRSRSYTSRYEEAGRS